MLHISSWPLFGPLFDPYSCFLTPIHDEGKEKLGVCSEWLERMNKSAPEKKALAAWLAQQTLVGTEWIAEMLWMGHRSSVSQAKKWVRETKEGRKWILKLK